MVPGPHASVGADYGQNGMGRTKDVLEFGFIFFELMGEAKAQVANHKIGKVRQDIKGVRNFQPGAIIGKIIIP